MCIRSNVTLSKQSIHRKSQQPESLEVSTLKKVKLRFNVHFRALMAAISAVVLFCRLTGLSQQPIALSDKRQRASKCSLEPTVWKTEDHFIMLKNSSITRVTIIQALLMILLLSVQIKPLNLRNILNQSNIQQQRLLKVHSLNWLAGVA